jgi:sarcosine oxidase subunit alpha
VKPGTRAVVFTNNDSAYAAALSLSRAGVAIAAIVEARSEQELTAALTLQARDTGIRVVAGSAVVAAHGSKRVAAVDIESLSGGQQTRIDCDLVCVSGGWNPTVHLFSQARGSLRYDESLATFVPDRSPLSIVTAGAVNGRLDLAQALADGHAAGLDADRAKLVFQCPSLPQPHRQSPLCPVDAAA